MLQTIDLQGLALRVRFAAAAFVLLPAVAAQAATFPVACSSAGLISAINAANSTAGPDVLQLAAGCTYTFNVADNVWYGPNALPAIASDITIEGNGATLQVNNGAAPISLRFFYVSGGLSPPRGASPSLPPGTLTLQHLTLKSGNMIGGSSSGGGGGAGMGGAIFNQGTLTLVADTFVGNQASGGATLSNSASGGAGMGADAVGANGGGFGASFGSYGGAGGVAGSSGSGGGGGFSADGSFAGGGNSGWGGSGMFNPSTAGEGGGGAGATPGGNGGDFGMGGQSGLWAGGGGGVGGGGAGGSNYGGGGGFGGGGGGGSFASGTGGFGAGGGSNANGGYGGGSGHATGGGGGAGMGGAIFNHTGTLTIRSSTFTNNKAAGGTSTVGGTAGAGLGGAIFNLQGSVSIQDSTLAFNTAQSASAAAGGAVYDVAYLGGNDSGTLPSQATLTLQNSILSNSSDGSAALADLALDQPNTVSGGAANTASSVVTYTQNNIVMATVHFGNVSINGTPITTDPQLRPLQNNGGPTQTLALLTGSPAIDNGNSNAATDQRGCPRNVGPAADIGAYESNYVSGLIFRDGFEGIVCL